MTTDYGVNAGWYEALKRKAEAAERLARALGEIMRSPNAWPEGTLEKATAALQAYSEIKETP